MVTLSAWPRTSRRGSSERVPRPFGARDSRTCTLAGRRVPRRGEEDPAGAQARRRRAARVQVRLWRAQRQANVRPGARLQRRRRSTGQAPLRDPGIVHARALTASTAIP
uniref:Uncharacterized protein n=1 Tax=Sipha flava TaxID=143950 RepID=A0A2S2R139_9HEMI